MPLLLSLCFFCLLGSVVMGAADPASAALESSRNWDELEAYQGKVSEAFFVDSMDRIYAPNADWRPWLEVSSEGVWIEKGDEIGGARMFLRFGDADPQPLEQNGLSGLRIALDPGHIGGEWGPIEERSFSVAGGPVVQEGDLTLQTAFRLADRLRGMGAEVFLTRESAEPVTDLRADDFAVEARLRLAKEEGADAFAARLFYRTAEIRARAQRIADWGGADVAIALHINAKGFEDPDNPALHDTNDAHVLINGCYLAGELASPAQRLEMLLRLLEGYHLEEELLGIEMVRSIRNATDLPPYVYQGTNAAALDEEGYLLSRNLLASRVFDCPVVFLEPWQANSQDVYAWAAAGDYEGLKEFNGVLRQSLPADYSDFVIEALSRRYQPAK